MTQTIDILLATYNGEKFLAQQIDSIFAQTYTEWRLLIRDDGSTDRTREIIYDYAKQYPNKIIAIEDMRQNLGVTNNFERLMECATAQYIMFCDQDDIWLSDKIEKSLNKIQEIEKKVGTNRPVLIYSDLKVCDENGNLIAESFWKYQKIDPTTPLDYARTLVQNNATGNTMIFNQAANKMALPFPKEAVMHDWWVALVALYLGKIDFLNDQTIMYRQHSKNVSGQKGIDIVLMLKKIPNYCLTLTKNITQAKSFLSRYETYLTTNQKDILRTFGTILQKNRLNRLIALIKKNYFSLTDLRDIVKMLILLSCRNEGTP